MDERNNINSSIYSLPSIHDASSIEFNSVNSNDLNSTSSFDLNNIDNNNNLPSIHNALSIDFNNNDSHKNGDNDINDDTINDHFLKQSFLSLPSGEHSDELNNNTCEGLDQTLQNLTIQANPEKCEIALSCSSINNTMDDDHEPEISPFSSRESQSFFVDGAQEIYQNIGLDILKLIAELPTTDLRRPLMSIVTKHATRDQAKVLMKKSKKVTTHEWAAARRHCRFPGVGRPVPPKPRYFRKKLNEDIVSEFLRWLHANDYIQNVAFGHKVASYCNGVHTTIEAVKMTSNQRQCIRNYAKEWQGNGDCIIDNIDNAGGDVELESSSQVQEDDMNILESDDQCCKTCPKTRTRCFREKGHEDRHSFTPKGRLSPSSIEKLLSSMTAGKIKSLAGLDDTDTVTGFENFANMKSLIRTLNDVARFSINSNVARDLISQVDSVAQFHKVGFPRHLGQGEIHFGDFKLLMNFNITRPHLTFLSLYLLRWKPNMHVS